MIQVHVIKTAPVSEKSQLKKKSRILNLERVICICLDMNLYNKDALKYAIKLVTGDNSMILDSEGHSR